MNPRHVLFHTTFISKNTITLLTLISLSFVGYLDVTTESWFSIALVLANMAVKRDPIMVYQYMIIQIPFFCCYKLTVVTVEEKSIMFDINMSFQLSFTIEYLLA